MDDSQVIQCEIDKNDLFGLEGYERIPISFQRGSYFDTVEYQFVPEIYTYYIMDKRKLTYKQATSFMCGKHQPTAYHVSKLNQEEVYARVNSTVDGGILIQSSLEEIFGQGTDGIVIRTDSEMIPINLCNFVS
uniref:Uncharacterized protein n=1 Tax=Clytia hemisphaerica TaxID=252671 RepID=A0A7M6DR25_9CNID